MNDEVGYDDTNQSVYLKNEYTPDTAVFVGSNTSPTYGAVAAVSAIVPDAHIPP